MKTIPLPGNWMPVDEATAIAERFEHSLPKGEHDGRILAVDLLNGSTYLADTAGDLNRQILAANGAPLHPTFVTRVGLGYYGKLRGMRRVDGPS